MKKAPVSSGSGTIAKATKMNPHAKMSNDMMKLPGGMGGQNLKKMGDCPQISKLD